MSGEQSHVSDHAVLRFLERECGVDVETLRRLIGDVCARGAAADAPVVRFAGVRFVLVDGLVVTTMPHGERLSLGDLKRAMRDARRS